MAEETKDDTTKFDFRLPRSLKDEMQAYAKRRNVSLAAITIFLYREALENDDHDQEAPQI